MNNGRIGEKSKMSNPDFPQVKIPPVTYTKLIDQMNALIKEYYKYLPILIIKNIDENEGIIDVYLAGHDGTNYVAKLHKTLKPGESCDFNSQTMQPIEDFRPDTGIQVLVRTHTMTPVWFNVKNMRDIDLKYRRVKPPTFPWWPPKEKIVACDVEKLMDDWVVEDQQAAMWYGGEITRA